MQPIFARIYKVDEATRTVYGRAAQEVVDRDNELFDYASSKPEFQKWSAEVFADTQGKSHGNVRSMHGNIAAGKLTEIDFLDNEKAIDVAAKIVDNNEWDKVMEGVHTGFSIGGRYARKWSEPINGKMVTRYTAVPSEISIVDRPCIPTAKFFSIHKRDGSIVEKEFVTGKAIPLRYGEGKVTTTLIGRPVFELVDGKVLFKGGPGSGPHSGAGKGPVTQESAAHFRVASAHDHIADNMANAHAYTKNPSAKTSSDAHEAAARAHRDASNAIRSGDNKAAQLSAHAKTMSDHANSVSSKTNQVNYHIAFGEKS